MVDVVEYCPYCESENEYEVEEGVWVAKCKTCGRPILLCDKCHEHDSCGDCPYDGILRKMTEEWKNGIVGKMVYWKDPDDDKCSDYCEIADVVDDVFVLRHIYDKDCDGIIEAYWDEIEFVDESIERKIVSSLM